MEPGHAVSGPVERNRPIARRRGTTLAAARRGSRLGDHPPARRLSYSPPPNSRGTGKQPGMLLPGSPICQLPQSVMPKYQAPKPGIVFDLTGNSFRLTGNSRELPPHRVRKKPQLKPPMIDSVLRHRSAVCSKHKTRLWREPAAPPARDLPGTRCLERERSATMASGTIHLVAAG
jgi:hypothetical protein